MNIYLQWPTNRKSYHDLTNSAILNYLERLLTSTSRSCHYLTLNIPETGYGHTCYRRRIRNHLRAWPFMCVCICVFIQVSLRQKLQKSVDIRLSYCCKNIKGAIFLRHSVCSCMEAYYNVMSLHTPYHVISLWLSPVLAVVYCTWKP